MCWFHQGVEYHRVPYLEQEEQQCPVVQGGSGCGSGFGSGCGSISSRWVAAAAKVQTHETRRKEGIGGDLPVQVADRGTAKSRVSAAATRDGGGDHRKSHKVGERREARLVGGNQLVHQAHGAPQSGRPPTIRHGGSEDSPTSPDSGGAPLPIHHQERHHKWQRREQHEDNCNHGARRSRRGRCYTDVHLRAFQRQYQRQRARGAVLRPRHSPLRMSAAQGGAAFATDTLALVFSFLENHEVLCRCAAVCAHWNSTAHLPTAHSCPPRKSLLGEEVRRLLPPLPALRRLYRGVTAFPLRPGLLPLCSPDTVTELTGCLSPLDDFAPLMAFRRLERFDVAFQCLVPPPGYTRADSQEEWLGAQHTLCFALRNTVAPLRFLRLPLVYSESGHVSSTHPFRGAPGVASLWSVCERHRPRGAEIAVEVIEVASAVGYEYVGAVTEPQFAGSFSGVLCDTNLPPCFDALFCVAPSRLRTLALSHCDFVRVVWQALHRGGGVAASRLVQLALHIWETPSCPTALPPAATAAAGGAATAPPPPPLVGHSTDLVVTLLFRDTGGGGPLGSFPSAAAAAAHFLAIWSGTGGRVFPEGFVLTIQQESFRVSKFRILPANS